MQQQFTIEKLDKAKHDRGAFRSGNRELDQYLQRRARQDQRNDVATCYVAIDTQAGRIAGYYTLSQFFVDRANLPDQVMQKFGRYGQLPATMLGRLAVDQVYQGKGLGGAILVDALERVVSFSNEISACCVVVDPIDGAAASFYRRHGFDHLEGQTRMFMPMADVRASLGAE